MSTETKTIDLSKFTFNEFCPGQDDIRYYFRRFELEIRVFRIIEDADKRDLILRCMGPCLFKLVNDNFDPISPDEKTYSEIKDFLEQHFKPATNIHAERTKFSQRFRRNGESIAEFIAALRTLAVNCKFKNSLDERLRDQLILGINDSRIQEHLFREHSDETATFNQIEKSALNYESAYINRETIESVIHSEHKNPVTSVNKINTPTQNVKKNNFNAGAKPTTFKTKPKVHGEMERNKFRIDKRTVCIRCGKSKHLKGEKCRAELATCRSCHTKGHFEKVCVRSGKAEFIHHIFYISNNNKYQVRAVINKKEINFQYDTGSGKSIIPESFYRIIGKPKLLKSKQLIAYPDKPIATLGDIKVKIKIGSKSEDCLLTVVPGNSVPILGKDLMEVFHLEPKFDVKYIDENVRTLESQLLEDYADIFDQTKIGTVRSFEAVIRLHDNAKPVICKARSVPYALKPAADKEIDRLIENGTLESVNINEQTVQWASPVVYVTKKNGQIRLCGDFKSTINKHMITEQYPYPTFEDIVSKLNGCTVFSVIDLKDAFLQVKVSEESRKYLVIATHRGYYRFCRMPFGISAAPIIFQKLMDMFLIGIEGVTWFQDDIAVGGRNIQEHSQRLRQVFEIFRKVGLKTQTSKIQLFKEEIKFLGHVINKTGISPDIERIRALREQPPPNNVSELRSFLGSVNYYSRFVKNLQILCTPLHELLTKNSSWEWTERHQNAFEKIRESISSPAILVHFDPKQPIILACDSSIRGLGAVIQHRIDGELKLIAAASRTLTPAERNYSNIDREALAIMFGLQKFYKYLIGHHFIIQSDHKPLERILNQHKEVPSLAASRLTRWAITLGAFDYEIEHRPGQQMVVPDALSRLPLPDKKVSKFEDSSFVYSIANHTIHELTLTRRTLRRFTEKDSVLSKVILYIEKGWPSKQNIEEALIPFFEKRDELTYEQRILLLNNRLVIPEKLRYLVIDKLHESHTGIVAMKSVARMSVWWPAIDRDIEQTVRCCNDCNEHHPKIAESPLLLWNNTGKPWDRVHIDLAQLNGENWLFIIDSHSRWLEVFKLKNVTSLDIIKCFRKLFSSYGICRIIVSDNGPQFTSTEFREFCEMNGVKHIRSTPYHSRSNGLAERVIRTFKTRFKKTSNQFSNQEHQLQVFLFTYRTTIHRATGCTPAKLFLNRELSTLFDRLKPDHINDVESLKSKFYHDRFSRHRDFEIGDNVWIKRGIDQTWRPGTIEDKTGPLSYRTQQGMHVHADHLRKREQEHIEHCQQSPTPVDKSDEKSTPETVSDLQLPESYGTDIHLPEVTTPEQGTFLRRSSRIRHEPKRFHEEFNY